MKYSTNFNESSSCCRNLKFDKGNVTCFLHDALERKSPCLANSVELREFVALSTVLYFLLGDS